MIDTPNPTDSERAYMAEEEARALAAEREAVARALSAHWRDMHTNEALGLQRMLAGHALDALAPFREAVTAERDSLRTTVRALSTALADTEARALAAEAAREGYRQRAERLESAQPNLKETP